MPSGTVTPAGGGGGSTPAIKQAFYSDGGSGTSVPPNADTKGNWSFIAGDNTILNLTNPVNPLAPAGGLYMFNGTISYWDAAQAGKYAQISAEADTADYGTGGNIFPVELTGHGSASGVGAQVAVRVGFAEYLIAGQAMGWFVKHDAAGSLTFYMNGMLVYMPCTGNSIV